MRDNHGLFNGSHSNLEGFDINVDLREPFLSHWEMIRSWGQVGGPNLIHNSIPTGKGNPTRQILVALYTTGAGALSFISGTLPPRSTSSVIDS